jgi:hypothetical protein
MPSQTKNIILILSLILLAVTFPLSCKGQKASDNMNNNIELHKYPASAGLGTLDVSFNLPVPLYVSENEEHPFDTLSFKRQSDGVMLFKTNIINLLKPYSMSGGNSDKEAAENIRRGLIRFPAVLSFRVLEVTDDFYRIVINEKTFATAVIKKRADYAVLPQRELFGFSNFPKDRDYKGYYIYETWEHLLLRAEHVSFDIDFGVYDAPEGNATYKGAKYNSLYYQAAEVKGDWVKLKKAPLLKSYFDGIENAEGWAKWKNDKDILIRIVEFTVE